MLNKQKHGDEMIELSYNGGIAMDKDTMKLCPCTGMECVKCYFYGGNYPCGSSKCQENLGHWANSEYIEPKTFSEQDKTAIIAMDHIKWVTRNDFGRVSGHFDKPVKSEGKWISCKVIPLDEITSAPFSAIKSTDIEPTHRSVILGEN